MDYEITIIGRYSSGHRNMPGAKVCIVELFYNDYSNEYMSRPAINMYSFEERFKKLCKKADKETGSNSFQFYVKLTYGLDRWEIENFSIMERVYLRE